MEAAVSSECWYMHIYKITAMFIVNTVRISKLLRYAFVSSCTQWNCTLLFVLDIYLRDVCCICKYVAQLDAENIFICVLFGV